MDINEQLVILSKQYKEEESIYSKLFSKLGMSDSVSRVLYALCEKGEPCSQNELCEEWSYPKQTVNSAVSVLTKNGLVEQIKSEGKGNRKLIVLTRAGVEFCEKNIIPMMRAEKAAFLRFNDKERELFLRMFERYLTGLREEFDKI